MKAYLVARLDVNDPEGFTAYREAVSPIIAAHGGRYLVRGGALNVKEGSAPARMVIVEFPDMATAEAFYNSDAYAPVLQQRLASAEGDVVLVAGVTPG